MEVWQDLRDNEEDYTLDQVEVGDEKGAGAGPVDQV